MSEVLSVLLQSKFLFSFQDFFTLLSNFSPSTLLPFYPSVAAAEGRTGFSVAKIFSFVFLLLFLFPSQLPAKPGGQEQEEQLVRKVTLVDRPEWIKQKDKNDDDRLPLPDPLIIGIDMEKEAFFKLFGAESQLTITAGTLVQGMNMIDLPTEGLFLRSGSYTYVLEVKAGEIEQVKKFVLDIRIENDSPGISEPEVGPVIFKPRIFEVSMFVGRQHIGSIQKRNTILSRVLKDALDKRVDRTYDPTPLPEARPPAISISPLTLAYLAYKALKKRSERKKREKIQYIYPQQITGGFFRKDIDGKEKPLDMTIKISSS